MLKGLFFAALLAAVAVPDTRAGQALSAWLDAFNSADSARQESFIKTHAQWMSADDIAQWRAETGGYDLLEVIANDKTNVIFRIRARANGAEEVGRLQISEAEPVAVTGLRTWRIPPGATADAVPLDAKARHKLIEHVADEFDRSYVYPELGQKMAADLREREKRGEYRSMLYGIDLASRLTENLREVSHDKHAEVRFSFFARPPESSANQAEAESRRLAASNCGFTKAEHLRPNIGYLKLDSSPDPQICAPTAAAAMAFLADSEALILDLRDNHGGHGGMNAFIASYLFDQRTHLNDAVDRAGKVTEESWTLPYVPGRKFIGTPVFVLTSKHTFSAAEDLTYSLKNLKRATLIGETTGGGAHPIDIKPLDEHFSVAVPVARSRSPITQTDWEGTGIEPDVKVAADQALDVALKLAADEIGKNRSKSAER